MILVDTSVWVDHLRSGNGVLIALLDDGNVLGHPWVVGELALGSLTHRHEVLRLLRGLPRTTFADTDEIMALIQREELSGQGIGFVDAALLAATRLTPDARLWTKDKCLLAVADRLELSFRFAEP